MGARRDSSQDTHFRGFRKIWKGTTDKNRSDELLCVLCEVFFAHFAVKRFSIAPDQNVKPQRTQRKTRKGRKGARSRTIGGPLNAVPLAIAAKFCENNGLSDSRQQDLGTAEPGKEPKILC
jgi:hypothetical protein